ncbi:alpha/beta hydrolase [Dongia sp.]|uniref:alpha/beta hydrolase n=1 Tax=Dongia sp. TaxID=1977262 RepID=UPI0035B374A5
MAPVQSRAEAEERVSLTAPDGVTVYGAAWRAKAGAPWILAFHQAGSSHGEYDPLAPAFVQAGYSVLAIDQRSGGSLYGVNETVTSLGASGTYEVAMGDLEAALAWARKEAGGAPVIAMGSSYSAALVFLLAAKHPDEIQGVLSFSPGEYLSDRHAVHNAIAKVTVPVYLTEGAGEEGDVTSIFDAAASTKKEHYKPGNLGIHGASTLRADKNPAGAQKNMDHVLAFLRAAFPPQ